MRTYFGAETVLVLEVGRRVAQLTVDNIKTNTRKTSTNRRVKQLLLKVINEGTSLDTEEAFTLNIAG